MKNKLSGIIVLISSLLILGANYIWAPVCGGSLQLADGGSCAMKCHYYAITLPFFAVLLLACAVCLLLLKDKKGAAILTITAALLIIALTNGNIGIGVCVKEGMRCHATALWGRIGALLALLGGVLGILLKNASDAED